MNLLRTLAERATAIVPEVAPRLPSLFEPTTAYLAAESEADVEVVAVEPPAPAPARRISAMPQPETPDDDGVGPRDPVEEPSSPDRPHTEDRPSRWPETRSPTSDGAAPGALPVSRARAERRPEPAGEIGRPGSPVSVASPAPTGPAGAPDRSEVAAASTTAGTPVVSRPPSDDLPPARRRQPGPQRHVPPRGVPSRPELRSGAADRPMPPRGEAVAEPVEGRDRLPAAPAPEQAAPVLAAPSPVRSPIPLPPPGPPASEDRSPEPAPGPSVSVTIGRIDIRAITDPPAAPRPPERSAPRLGLEEYLRQRSGGRRA